MDNTAIQEIQDNAAARDIGRKVNLTEVPVAALPEHYTIHSLEQYENRRSRFRAMISTHHIDSFTAYIRDVHIPSEEPEAIFVDPDKVRARVIFDLGTIDKPGHCEHQARLDLIRTAEFEAYEDLFIHGGVEQRKLAEWLEDWREHIYAFDGDGSVIDIRQLVNVVRRVTVEGVRQADSTEENFSSSRSTLESISARSEAGSLPEVIEFTAHPYHGLPEQRFRFRLSVRTGGDKISFGAFRIQQGRDQEVIGKNFVEALEDRLQDDAPVYLGSIETR